MIRFWGSEVKVKVTAGRRGGEGMKVDVAGVKVHRCTCFCVYLVYVLFIYLTSYTDRNDSSTKATK